MKKFLGLLTFVALVTAAVIALRDDAEAFIPQPTTQVVCNGNNGCCADTGVRNFIYDVQLAGGATVTSIQVGTEDSNPAHFINLIMPTGWSFAIQPGTPRDRKACTAHGTLSSPNDRCTNVMIFSGPVQSTNFTLGYDYTQNVDIHDAVWTASNGKAASWARPVGNGLGPVHSPGFP